MRALLRCGLRAPAELSRERGLYFTLQSVGACEKFEAAAGSDPVLDLLALGAAPLRSKGAGFLTVYSPFPPADSDSFFVRGWMVEGRKTRTLHKNPEGCGTRISIGDVRDKGRSVPQPPAPRFSS